MLRIPKSIEYVYACFALWFFFGNPVNLLTVGGGGGQMVEAVGGNLMLPAMSMALYALAGFALLFFWQSGLRRLIFTPQAIALLILLIILIASAKWSDYPRYTLRRSILISGASTFAMYFSIRFNFKQQLKMLAIAFCCTALLSVLFGIFIPQYGIMSLPPHVGAWRGVHMHKNDLGPQMAFISIFLVSILYTKLFRGVGRIFITVSMICAVFLVLVSQSTTGQMAMIALLLIFIACNSLKLNYLYMVPIVGSILLVAAAGSLYLQANADQLFGAFGKGSDLSGRDRLWPPILDMVSRKPLFGYGYEGFWRGFGSPGEAIWNTVGWPTPHAHNGFLEVLLAAGWVGGTLFLVSFLLSLVTSIKLVRLTKMTGAICPVLALVFIVLSNITESNLFKSDVWILYIWVALSEWTILSEGFSTEPPIPETPVPKPSLQDRLASQ
ncbi:MAG: O-antigen ligase family protein [Cyanobacteria bacterium J06623_4]